jgi:hypothetical protein
LPEKECRDWNGSTALAGFLFHGWWEGWEWQYIYNVPVTGHHPSHRLKRLVDEEELQLVAPTSVSTNCTGVLLYYIFPFALWLYVLL